MRRPSSRPRPPLPRTFGFVFCLTLVLTTTIRGQEPSAGETSLARYVPKDNVVFYLEYQGLDAHAEAWKKTAACKILNETPAGVMLDEVMAQLLGRLPAVDPTGKPIPERGNEIYKLIKHVARSGFLFAGVMKKDSPKESPVILVIRNGFKDKDVRTLLASMIQARYAPNTKPQAVVRAGHKIIGGVDALGSGFAWWVEDTKKEDFVLLYSPPETADVILETLDGKRPSAQDHPKRAELLKAEGRFLPNGLAFLDSQALGIDWNNPSAKKFEKDYGYLGLSNIASVDLRWGFQDEAMMTVARVATSGPRKGVLSFLDASALDKTKLPPIPPNVNGFTATSLDFAGSLDRLRAQMKSWTPEADEMVDKLVDRVKEKTKLRLKEDILAHIGPKVAWYVLPGKAAAAPAGGANLLGAMMAGGGMDLVPKLAVVFDIDDPTAFGKVLDEAMAVTNREFKSMGRPPGEAPAKGGRARGPALPALEFRPTSGETKMYVLNVPPELSGEIPASLRPAVRIGPKHAVLAVSPDIARAVLETKADWTPGKELATVFQGLPSKLKVLNVTDPRETLPQLLSSLPATIQTIFNMATMARSPAPPGGPAAGAPNAPRFPGAPGAPGAPAAGPAPGGPPPLVLRIDAAKLPSADSIKALLFPSVFSVESNEAEIRIVSRDAFPTVGDPSKMAVATALILPAVQAARAAAQRAAGIPPGMAPAPGAVPPPGGPPPRGTPPGAAPGRPRAGSGNNPN